MNSILRLVGIAKKAGRLEIGEEPVGGVCRSRQAKLILLAADAAENSMRRARHFGDGANVQTVVTPFTKAELGMCVGRSSCAMLALTDAGLAAALVKKLAEHDPAQYAEVARQLAVRADKVLQRQKEELKHQKNLRLGKKKPWSPPVAPGAQPKTALNSSAPQGNIQAAQARIEQKKISVPTGKITIKGKLPAGLKRTP